MNINFKDLTFENVGEWPYPIKVGTLIAIAVIVFVIGYEFIITANISQYHALVLREAILKEEFENLQHQASNLHAYREQMKTMQERFGNMLKQLPTKNEMPGLLEDISKTGIASGLTFDLFAPQPEIVHDFYIELPIEISVVGNYHQLAVFLSRVAQMRRIVTLHDFIVEAPTENNKQKNNNGDQLVMKIKATIYRYRTK